MPAHDCRLILGVVPDPAALFERLTTEVPWTQQMRSRKTASMGVPYNYAGASYPVATWHPEVRALADALTDQLAFMPTNCLLNYYEHGSNSLGWHSDDVQILAPGTGVGIVSLGVARPLKLRRSIDGGFEYDEIMLEPGSLLTMGAAMQAEWVHSLRRCTTDEARISLSFRQIVRWPDVQPVVVPRG